MKMNDKLPPNENNLLIKNNIDNSMDNAKEIDNTLNNSKKQFELIQNKSVQ